ncbi:MAG: glycerophosphodiester phosphodiesterase family protein [Chloroflexota bacterium]
MSLLYEFPRPILFAHRGACAHAPENTLASFRMAFEQGADAIELDAKLSTDGHVMVIHDATVDRTTNGRGRVSQLTLAELRALDAGSFFGEQFRGEKIPSLEEVFESEGQKGIINVELTNYYAGRDHLAEKVCELVKRHRLEDRIIFSSFFAYNLKKTAELLPNVPRGLLALDGWKGIWARSFGFMFGDYHALHPYITDVDHQQVQRVHRLKRRVHVWTANSEKDILRLKDWGVDGIFTDDPQTAVRALRRGA